MCPLCSKRPAKRACPAIHQQICPVCCATKRGVEISCPADCRYLENAQKHPAANVRRQIDHDIGILMGTLGRVSEQQLQLFLLFLSQIRDHKPDGFGRLADADVALATGALAKALETSSRGVIYEEPTSSVVAEGLRRVLKTTIDEITQSGGSRAEREIAEVLRGIERGAKHGPPEAGTSSSSYLELASRILKQQAPATKPAPPLIVAP